MKRNDLLVFSVLTVITLSARANAYLDAGAGSMALQMLVAGILGASFTLKTYWNNFRNRARKGE